MIFKAINEVFTFTRHENEFFSTTGAILELDAFPSVTTFCEFSDSRTVSSSRCGKTADNQGFIA